MTGNLLTLLPSIAAIAFAAVMLALPRQPDRAAVNVEPETDEPAAESES